MKKYTDYSLKAHNTFGIDAYCRHYIEYASENELSEILDNLRQTPDEPYLHIGAGSNLLFTRDFPGTVLHSSLLGVEETSRRDAEVWVRAGAGEVWDDFVAQCVERGFYGLENLSLIPGEVGASAVQNIGAYGSEVGRFIDRVEGIDTATGQMRTLRHEECKYGYRDSIFKQTLRGKFIVTHVIYRLSLCFRPDLSYSALQRELERRGQKPDGLKPHDLRDLVVSIRQGKLPDPSVLGSAGSFFMNPIVTDDKFRQIQEKYPQVPHYGVAGGYKIPAGWLIEQCGWKGRRLGPAGVYDRQALVLVNHGGASGSDIVRLSQAVCADVYARFGIELRPEVNFI